MKDYTTRELYRILMNSWDYAMGEYVSGFSGDKPKPLTPAIARRVTIKLLRRLPEPTQKERVALEVVCYNLPFMFCGMIREMVKILSKNVPSSHIPSVSLIRESSKNLAKRLHMRGGAPRVFEGQQKEQLYKDWEQLRLVQGLENPDAISRLSRKFHASTRTIRRALTTIQECQAQEQFREQFWEDLNQFVAGPKNRDAVSRIASKYHVSTRAIRRALRKGTRSPRRSSNLWSVLRLPPPPPTLLRALRPPPSPMTKK